MKIIAAADHHFCEALRFDECVSVHERIAKLVEDEKPDLFLSAGDVYHRASTPVERLAAAEFFQRVAEICPVIIVRGNHDRIRDLELLRRLRTKFDVVVEEAYGVHGCCACLAWPDRAMLARAAGAHSTADDINRTAGEAYRSLLLGMRQQFDAGARLAPRILLAHAMVDGAKTGKGQPLVGQPLNIPLDDFRLVGADIVILGHIHQAQQFDSHSVYYCGSPFRTEYGQTEEKRVLVIEFDDDPHHPTVRSVSTDARPMVDVDAAYAPDDVAKLVAMLPEVGGADVRLRYRVDVDHRQEAKEAAKMMRERLIGMGAATVVIDDEVQISSSARVPELLDRQGADAQLRAYWDKRPVDQRGEELRAEALQHMPELISEFGLNDLGGRTVGSYRRLRAHGILPFDGDVDLNLEALSGLIVLTGPNGVGKTTMLELLPGIFYRKTATRGVLVDLATERYSWVELETEREDGQRIKVRLLLDGKIGKSEAVVTPATFEGTSVREYDRWVSENYPPRELTDASMFSPQGSGGWIAMDSAGRKTVILRALGLERLEKAASHCRGKAEAAKTSCDKLALEAAHIEITVRDVEALQREIIEGESKLVQLRSSIEETKASVERVRVDHQNWKERSQQYNEAMSRAQELRQQCDKCDTLEQLCSSNVKRLEQEIDESVEDLRNLDMLRKLDRESNEQARKLELELAALLTSVSDAKTAEVTARREYESARSRLRRAQSAKVLDLANQMDKAVRDKPKLEQQLVESREAYRATRDKLRSAEAEREQMAARVLNNIAVGWKAIEDLDDDATELPEAKLVATATANLTSRAHARKQELAEEIDRLRRDVDEQEQHGRRIADLLLRASNVADRSDELQAAVAELAAAEAEERKARLIQPADLREAEIRRAQDFVGEANKRASLARDKRVHAAGRQAVLEKQRRELDDARSALNDARDNSLAVKSELSTLPPQEPPGEEPDLRSHELELSESAFRLDAIESSLGEKRAQLQKTLAQIDELEAVLVKHRACKRSAEVFTLLGNALGAQELQAALVDAIGPELTATTNELLHACWGSRWSVKFHVAPVGSKRESCDLLVHDRDKDRTFDARRLSGGQSVIVGEAVSMALAIIGARRTGQRVLVRDESGAHLDRQNVPAYAAMLRRGAQMVGATHVFLVTHQPELIELADHVLTLPLGPCAVDGSEVR